MDLYIEEWVKERDELAGLTAGEPLAAPSPATPAQAPPTGRMTLTTGG